MCTPQSSIPLDRFPSCLASPVTLLDLLRRSSAMASRASESEPVLSQQWQ